MVVHHFLGSRERPDRSLPGRRAGRSCGRHLCLIDVASPAGRFGFKGLDPLGLLGDEDVGVEELADELDEELVGVVGGHRTFLSGDSEGGRPVEG